MDGVLNLAPAGSFCVETAIALDEGTDLFSTRFHREALKGTALVSVVCNLISLLRG